MNKKIDIIQNNKKVVCFMDLRATRVEINISQFHHNLLVFKKMIGDKPLCLAIKGNAYGHGLVSMAFHAQEFVDVFGVATVGEGIKLRENGITQAIFVMSSHVENEIPLLCQYKLTPFVSHGVYIDKYQYWAEYYQMMFPIHLKIDTGMGRSGVMPDNALFIAQKILDSPNLILEGLCTHFAMADESESIYTSQQLQIFQKIIDTLQLNGISPPLIHAANTAGIINFRESHFTLARLGIGAYGYANHEEIAPVLSFKSKITIVKTIPKGYTVSYGCTWTAQKTTTIGIIPVGYADGYQRSLSNKAKVMIKGQLYPIIGVVCMDQIMVELPNNSQLWLEEDVLLYGNDSYLNADTVARWANTISYELLVSIAERVPRIYL